MRQRKAIINSGMNVVTFIFTFIPQLIIRRLFLEILGDDLLGLNSLYTNIIGWLSIVELGVGTAIIFSLYKPFAEKDYPRVRAYLKFYQKFYLSVGLIVLGSGILLTPFLGVFIDNQSVNMTDARLGFILSIVNSFITYLFSSRLCVLNVAQEGYIVTLGTTLAKLVIFLIQWIVLAFYPDFVLFIGIQIIVNLVFYIILNSYTIKRYKWVNSGEEKLDNEEKTLLLKNVRAMFMHKIGWVFVFSTDSLVISKFVGLASLAKYTNYNTVISAVQRLISSALQGVTASIGNMLVERDHTYASVIHKKIFFLNFWITSFATIVLYNTLNQFIGLWIGKEYLLDHLTYSVLLMNLYFYLMRGSIEKFKEASGSYIQDRYAPLVEGLVNLISSLILVKYFGLAGVFIGTMISNFTVLFWVQPHIVYKYVFKESLLNYVIMYFKYACVALIVLFLTNYLTLPVKNNFDFLSFFVNCSINIIVINLVYILLFHRKEEFKYILNMVKGFSKNR